MVNDDRTRPVSLLGQLGQTGFWSPVKIQLLEGLLHHHLAVW